MRCGHILALHDGNSDTGLKFQHVLYQSWNYFEIKITHSLKPEVDSAAKQAKSFGEKSQGSHRGLTVSAASPPGSNNPSWLIVRYCWNKKIWSSPDLSMFHFFHALQSLDGTSLMWDMLHNQCSLFTKIIPVSYGHNFLLQKTNNKGFLQNKENS